MNVLIISTFFLLFKIFTTSKKKSKKKLNKYRSIQVLLLKFHREKWFVKIQLNDKIKRVKRLFFVNKIIFKNLLIKNFEVLIMNVIYKTNRYKMFLLIIVYETIFNTIFYIIFAFLIDEIEKNFAWIIEQIKTLYVNFNVFKFKIIVIDRNFALMITLKKTYSNIKNLLYVWHVNKNVVINCRFFFIDDEKMKKLEKNFMIFIKRSFMFIRSQNI